MPFDLVTADENPFVNGRVVAREGENRISRSYTLWADEPRFFKEERFLGADDGD